MVLGQGGGGLNSKGEEEELDAEDQPDRRPIPAPNDRQPMDSRRIASLLLQFLRARFHCFGVLARPIETVEPSFSNSELKSRSNSEKSVLYLGIVLCLVQKGAGCEIREASAGSLAPERAVVRSASALGWQ
jgi:hypothetical protein